MPKILAYIRTSTAKQDLNNQRLEILEYARQNDLKIDDFIQAVISTRMNRTERRIPELMDRLSEKDAVITCELSRLGRSTSEVIQIINQLIEKNIRIIILKQNLDINHHDINSKIIVTMFSLFGELERDLISKRTKEALRAKKESGSLLGKPKGTIQKSKFDSDLFQINELLTMGVSIRKISKILGYSNHNSLNTYIKKRRIKEKIQSKFSQSPSAEFYDFIGPLKHHRQQKNDITTI